jgi:hypothetical protein
MPWETLFGGRFIWPKPRLPATVKGTANWLTGALREGRFCFQRVLLHKGVLREDQLRVVLTQASDQGKIDNPAVLHGLDQETIAVQATLNLGKVFSNDGSLAKSRTLLDGLSEAP